MTVVQPYILRKNGISIKKKNSVEVGVYRNPSYTSTHTHVDGKWSQDLEPKDNSLHVFALDGIFIFRKSNFVKRKAEDVQMCTEQNCPYLKKVPHLNVQEWYMLQFNLGFLSQILTRAFLCSVPLKLYWFHM